PVLRRCGVAASLPEACVEARAVADYLTAVPGGNGAVRDLIEWLLKLQGRWDELTARYVARA
ncbi:MAG: phenylphosphate carboxylase subunit delta, partial [Gemmataceae bacterium]|nr:phenylphosphate carboxylase subunit delta [Gemmataceae bacterium]